MHQETAAGRSWKIFSFEKRPVFNIMLTEVRVCPSERRAVSRPLSFHMNQMFRFLIGSSWILSICLGTIQEARGQRSLERRRSQWEKRKPFSYSYEYQVRCFCPEAVQGPFRVVVRADTIVSVNEIPYDGREYRNLLTPDQLFDRAKWYLRRKPYRKKMEYHPDYGFIQSAFFDPRSGIMDDDFLWTIRDFTVVR